MAPSHMDKGIVDLLEKAVGSKIENFEVTVHDGNQKGEGFLGEMTFVSLRNKKTLKDFNLVVKQVRPSETENTKELMRESYFREIYYYTKVFPALENFQKSYPHIRKFDNYPKCYTTTLEPGFEKLALENLKFKKYELHEKTQPAGRKLIEKLFRSYADLHAAGYAFKHHKPEFFHELTEVLLKNAWVKFIKLIDIYPAYIDSVFLKLKQILEEEAEEKIIIKFEKYVRNAYQLFSDSAKYNGSYGTILHGDCWSNNIMLKYNASREVEDVKLVDFQLGSVASPVIDLAYNFYSSADKECLDKLEDLLKLYHKNLSENLKKYGLNPEEIYPYEILKKEWKENCQFGFIMGTMVWKIRLATNIEELATLNEMMDSKDESQPEDLGIKVDEVEYKKRMLYLIRHMYDNDLL